MSLEKIAAIVFVSLIILAAILVFVVRLPRRLKYRFYVNKWRELQNLCRSKDTWPLAVISADNLVDDAMKRLRISGKTMGERIVSAERMFTDNDSLWQAHKLRNKIAHGEEIKLTQKDVEEALVGFRQALKDLGAL